MTIQAILSRRSKYLKRGISHTTRAPYFNRILTAYSICVLLKFVFVALDEILWLETGCLFQGNGCYFLELYSALRKRSDLDPFPSPLHCAPAGLLGTPGNSTRQTVKCQGNAGWVKIRLILWTDFLPVNSGTLSRVGQASQGSSLPLRRLGN